MPASRAGREGGKALSRQAGSLCLAHMDRRPLEEPEMSEEEHSLNASPPPAGQTSAFPPTQDASTGASQ